MAFHDYDFKVKFRNGRIEIGYFKEYQRHRRPVSIPLYARRRNRF